MATVKLTAPHGSGVVTVDSDRAEKYEALGWTRVTTTRRKKTSDDEQRSE